MKKATVRTDKERRRAERQRVLERTQLSTIAGGDGGFKTPGGYEVEALGKS